MKKKLIFLLTFFCFALMFSQTKKKKTVYQKQNTVAPTISNSTVLEFNHFNSFSPYNGRDLFKQREQYSKFIIPNDDNPLITLIIGNKKSTIKRTSEWELNYGRDSSKKCSIYWEKDYYNLEIKPDGSVSIANSSVGSLSFFNL